MPVDVERIAFDQDGDPYPRSNGADGLELPPQPPNRNVAFTLRTFYATSQPSYDREALLDRAAGRIVDGMRASKARRVVFLIKGFNNSYAEFEKEYAWIRDEVISLNQPEPLYFVQVYWDAIHRGRRTFPIPLAYFADSLTYSNHAGDCGLRDILRRLPSGTDVTFLTHSRGAAVALAAISDAKYDEGITNVCRSSMPGHSLPAQLGDVRLVAFAPAVGDGHVRAGVDIARADIFARLDRFYVGYNPNDPAVTKKYFGIDIPDRFGGDTRLGGNEGYVRHIDELFAKEKLEASFQVVRFDRKSHDWRDYVALSDRANCLLWAGKLVTGPSPGCTLSQ
jgi:hypothetical protein